jgi:hypothetical protein
MFTIILEVAGFHVTNLLISQRSFNSEYFIREILQPLVDRPFPGGEFLLPPRLWCILTTAESICQNDHKGVLKKIRSSLFHNRLLHGI